MTDTNEKLSWLLDDYPADDDGSCVDDVLDDVNLQYRVRRYRMIGEVMRGELPPAIDTGFHAAVMQKIHAEGESRQGAQPRLSDTGGSREALLGWARLKPFAGLAVAASVALATIAIWQPLQRETGLADETVVSADQQKIIELAGQRPAAGVVPASTALQPLGTRWKIDRETPGMQEKLNAYLVNHTEYSNSVQGLIPQARVAGFDAQR
jgi:negative regulator of sigma E activity